MRLRDVPSTTPVDLGLTQLDTLIGLIDARGETLPADLEALRAHLQGAAWELGGKQVRARTWNERARARQAERQGGWFGGAGKPQP